MLKSPCWSSFIYLLFVNCIHSRRVPKPRMGTWYVILTKGCKYMNTRLQKPSTSKLLQITKAVQLAKSLLIVVLFDSWYCHGLVTATTNEWQSPCQTRRDDVRNNLTQLARLRSLSSFWNQWVLINCCPRLSSWYLARVNQPVWRNVLRFPFLDEFVPTKWPNN